VSRGFFQESLGQDLPVRFFSGWPVAELEFNAWSKPGLRGQRRVTL
jgi:hypothetical protein